MNTYEKTDFESLIDNCRAHNSWTALDEYEPTEPPEPTNTQPGSKAKVDVLAERYRHGMSLFLDEDYQDRDKPTFVEAKPKRMNVVQVEERY